jgi:hypothetical protein
MEKIINNVKKVNSIMTIIEHTKESPFLFTKIIKSGIKNCYHVITEWKTEHVTHRMMRPIEIIESYPVSGFDLPDDKKTNQI